MNGIEIITAEEAAEWLRIDYDDPNLPTLIETAYDYSMDAINDFTTKLLSARFKRKLKLFMLNIIVSLYDDRGIEGNTAGENKDYKLKFTNRSLLLQLQCGEYKSTDV